MCRIFRDGFALTISPISVEVDTRDMLTWRLPRKRILIAHPYIHPVGGGNAVAAWAIQALPQDYDVTLALLGPIDIAGLNRSFGTSLDEKTLEVRVAPEKYRRMARWMPTQGALFESSLAVRWAKELDGENHFAVILSTQNEADFGRPAIQYIHFPAWYLPRPAVEMKWFHYIPGVLGLYRSVCFGFSGTTKKGLRRNLSLANSTFVADRIRETHEGSDPILLYPPVPGEFPDVAWEARKPTVIAVGRFASYKRWGMALEIVETVRRKGYDLGFTLIGQIGHPDDVFEKQKLRTLADERPWFRILTDLTRQQLTQEVASHRYGIHTMENEHFGIAVAELQRAGCITFVHATGGPVEIVGGDARLAFNTVAEAADKIAQAVGDEATGRELLALVRSRHDSFSTERFCNSLREIVAEFEGSHPA